MSCNDAFNIDVSRAASRSRASAGKHKRARIDIKFLISDSPRWFLLMQKWILFLVRFASVVCDSSKPGWIQIERARTNMNEQLVLMSATPFALIEAGCSVAIAHTHLLELDPALCERTDMKRRDVPVGWAPACFPTDRAIIALMLDRLYKRSLHNLSLSRARVAHASRVTCIMTCHYNERLASARIGYVHEL